MKVTISLTPWEETPAAQKEQEALEGLEQTINKLAALTDVQEPSETVTEWRGGVYSPALRGGGWAS